MIHAIALALLFGVPLVLYSQPNESAPFSQIEVSPGKSVARPSAWVIQSDGQWRRFLREILGDSREPLAVDFQKNTVVAIFAGEKPTGGYSVRVEKVTDDSRAGKPSRGTVHYRVVGPPAGAMVAQVLTFPYVLVRIEKKLEIMEFQPPIRRSPGP